ncbi:Uncharacterized protein specific for M.kandleri, MK-45 family [Methanopyrus kandleri AV19]|uniref:Uncharacterized protein specific for M.kandleri, MK-45 family n=1 Tax=Methanopyrus kandleri (strain AV19 / DSM 6324 / JCM 9639 / NBRC 100938) TaxID=190192 RepID=Q8TVN5_METKA|nr:Uncharacterized protein specific for M.kandleri, MK-45 family [Methanopyrus kandleri AV19]
MHLASRISTDRRARAKAEGLTAFGSALQTLSVGIAAALGTRLGDGEVEVTNRAVESLGIRPPFDEEKYLRGLTSVRDDPNRAYETMYRALWRWPRKVFRELHRTLEEDQAAFAGIVDYLWEEIIRQARESPALDEFVREVGKGWKVTREAAEATGLAGSIAGTVGDLLRRSLSRLHGGSEGDRDRSERRDEHRSWRLGDAISQYSGSSEGTSPLSKRTGDAPRGRGEVARDPGFDGVDGAGRSGEVPRTRPREPEGTARGGRGTGRGRRGPWRWLRR